MSPSRLFENRPPHQPTAIERAALAWVARLDRGLTAEEKGDFERWLAADVRHAELFDEFDGTWSLLDRVREFPAPAVSPGGAPPQMQLAEPGLSGSGAAQGHAFVEPVVRQSPVSQARHPASRPFAVTSLAAAAVITLAFFGSSLTTTSDHSSAAFTSTETTRLGDLRTVNLPDGSFVRLNTESTMEVRFSAKARWVRLNHGEAHFTVAKDRSRPFTVSAAGVAVRAVGTAFNIRLRAETVEVLVTDGKVQLEDERGQVAPVADTAPASSPETAKSGRSSPSAQPPAGLPGIRSLSAGEIITIPLSPTASAPSLPVVISPVQIEQALAWRERRLEFVSAPLSEMVAEFNRYNRRKLAIVGAELAAQHFGGNFRSDDAAGFVRVLEAHFRVVAEEHENETILRAAP